MRRIRSANAPLPPRRGPQSIGAVALGTASWALHDSPLGPRPAERVLRAALESGVTLVDTALVYSTRDEAGYSERLLGKALRSVTDHERPLVATKGGHYPVRRQLRRRRPAGDGPRELRTEPARTRRRVDRPLLPAQARSDGPDRRVRRRNRRASTSGKGPTGRRLERLGTATGRSRVGRRNRGGAESTRLLRARPGDRTV